MNQQLDPKIRIRAPLRCQGIGRLDCAEHTESGMRMAVRWLPLDANGDAAAKAVEQLPVHPTLPTIRQTGKTGSAVYVAMDFPDGQMLSTMLSEPLAMDRLARMGAQLCDALATIHAQGVTHGELSAESVLVTHERDILWDMPLVIANRLTDRRGEERVMGQLARAALYLSPERAMGGPTSTAADVYALGAVLCIAGGAEAPVGGSTLALLHRVAIGQWAPAPVDSMAAPLRQLLTRMVAKEPTARPTAREAAEEFSRLGLRPVAPLVAEVVTPGEPVAQAMAKLTSLKTGALLVVTGSVLAAVALYWTMARPVAPVPALNAPVALAVPAPVVIPPAPPPTVQAAPQEEVHEILLEPLLTKAPRKAKVSKASTKAPAKAAEKKRAVVASPVTYVAPKAEDFGFLEANVERPKEELKRPSF